MPANTERGTQDTSAKMLERIRALLAKAEDNAATTAEAEAYTAKATELMARYGIDRAMLAAADPTTDIVGDRVITITGSYAIDKQKLLGWVAEAVGCKAVLRSGGRRQVHLFGFGADLERAEMLYTSLLIQAFNALGKVEGPVYSSPVGFRKSWLEGFSSMVVSRLKQAEAQAKQQATTEYATSGGPSVELVLADRSMLVQHRQEQAYPKLGKTRARRLSSRSGYMQGMDAGRRADIGTTRVTGSGRAALGGGQR